MADYTTYFTLAAKLSDKEIIATPPMLENSRHYTDEELLAELNAILRNINTLDDYEKLIEILSGIRSTITLRFLYLFFQALVEVESRIWKSCGMNPPFEKIMEDNLDLLLERYETFVLNLEEALIDWANANGVSKDPVKYNFVMRRNKIYAAYVSLAGEIINVDDSD